MTVTVTVTETRCARYATALMADERLVSLLQRRTAARAAKDYATADQLSLCFTRVPVAGA